MAGLISLPSQCLCQIARCHTVKDVMSLEMTCNTLQVAFRLVELPPVTVCGWVNREWDAAGAAWSIHGNSSEDWGAIFKLQKGILRISSLRLGSFWTLPADFFAQATRLTCLEFFNCLEGTFFPPSIVSCTQLKQLTLATDVEDVPPRATGNSRVLAQLPLLDTLTLSTGNTHPELFQNVSFTLTSLRLSWHTPDRQHIEGLTSLQRLRIDYVPLVPYTRSSGGVVPPLDAHCWALPSLTSLTLCHCEFDDPKPAFSRAPQLQELALLRVGARSANGSGQVCLGLDDITQLSSLKDLSIWQGQIALPAGISRLTELTCLRVYAKMEGPGELPALTNLQQLQELQWPVASEIGLQQLQQQLAQLRNLRIIYLWADTAGPERAALEAVLQAVNTDCGDGRNRSIQQGEPTYLMRDIDGGYMLTERLAAVCSVGQS